MEKEFKFVLSYELFDKTKHSHFHYAGSRDCTAENLRICLQPKEQFGEKSKHLGAMGANLTEIKPQGLTQEENEAAWHMRKENDQAIWNAAKEKEKKDKAEKEELIKDYGEDAINFIKKIDDTKTN